MSGAGPITGTVADGVADGSVWREALSEDEVAELLEKSDLHGALTILGTWGMIAGCFALVAIWPNPITIVAAVCLLGARQLGLAVIMHDASHRSLFASRWTSIASFSVSGSSLQNNVPSYRKLRSTAMSIG